MVISDINNAPGVPLKLSPPLPQTVVCNEDLVSSMPVVTSSAFPAPSYDLSKVTPPGASNALPAILPPTNHSSPAATTTTKCAPQLEIGDFNRFPAFMATPPRGSASSGETPQPAQQHQLQQQRVVYSSSSSSSSSYKSASELKEDPTPTSLPRFAISIEDGPKSPINLKELSPGLWRRLLG